MSENEWLAERFEEHRTHLRSVAYRMLGSVNEADDAAVQMGATKEVRGSTAVAETFSGRARAAQPALVDGDAGLVWAQGGQPVVLFGFTITGGKIVGIDMVADSQYLRDADVVMLRD